MDFKEERRIKHQRVVEYLDAHGLDAAVLARRCNFNWYTCGARNYVSTAADMGNSFLAVTRDGAKAITSNIEAPRLRMEDLATAGIDVVEFPYFDLSKRDAAFREAIGNLRAAADAPLPFAPLPALEGDFDRLRRTLTEGEVARYRDVCRDVVSAVEYVAQDAQRGTREDELAGMVAGALMCSGCQPWVVLTAADDRIERFRHPLPTDKRVRRMFMIAACAERRGLICAATRLASFAPLDGELARKHKAVMTVDVAMIGATRPGATLGEAFREGQAAYAAAGYEDQWRMHHQGGPTGYLPREVIATPNDATPVLANQAFAWNPSIAGTKSEDTIICLPHSTELLAPPTNWPKTEATWKGITLSRPEILIR
ncbi:MAG: M24 family metallopeptidase [Phycisphaerae bacterium]